MSRDKIRTNRDSDISMTHGGMTSQEKKAVRRGPESRYWNQLKGCMIHVEFKDERVKTCRLRWVDRYSIGVSAGDGREQLINKSVIAMVWGANDRADYGA